MQTIGTTLIFNNSKKPINSHCDEKHIGILPVIKIKKTNKIARDKIYKSIFLLVLSLFFLIHHSFFIP